MTSRGRKPRKPAPLTIQPVSDEEDILELLAPFKPWRAKDLVDPRQGSLAWIADGFLLIVRGEGPILDHRAHRIYTKAAGLGRASRAIKETYDQALARLIESGRVKARPDDPTQPEGPMVYRATGASSLSLRERGDRSIDEIPLEELAGLIRKLEVTRGEAYASEEDRFRRILDVYDLLRLTGKTRARLKRARELAKLPDWSQATSMTGEAADAPDKPGPRPRKPRRRLRHG